LICFVMCLLSVTVVLTVLFMLFFGAILNGPIRTRVERGYVKRHPGHELRLGELSYTLGNNRLLVQSFALKSTNMKVESGTISLTGVHWLGLLLGTVPLGEAWADAHLEVNNLDLKFPEKNYGIRCTRLHALLAKSELIAEGIGLEPLLEDEALFAMSPYRQTRFRLQIPDCQVSGLSFADLLEKKSFLARRVQINGPSLHALANLEKPDIPFVKSPLMVAEALASIRQLVQIDEFSISGGMLTYCERVVAQAPPGVLTITEVDISAQGIDTRARFPAELKIRAQGKLMNKGLLELLMTIPLKNDFFSLHYSGSLAAMNLNELNAFLELVEHIRLKSGTVQKALFEINVADGRAKGHVRARYQDLRITILDKETGSKKGLDNRLATLFANLFKIRHGSSRDSPKEMKQGQVDYTKSPELTFAQFIWFALRSGVLDIINR